MSTAAWVVISILGLICLVLVAALYVVMNAAGKAFAGLIIGFGGPDITKKNNRR